MWSERDKICGAFFPTGVPVVTLRTKGAGSVHSHNVSASLLIQAGLEELVAETEEDYIRIALELAGVSVLSA
jgi:predicted O-linked N-acetylglucosamine transferase (SPINDLY family)